MNRSYKDIYLSELPVTSQIHTYLDNLFCYDVCMKVFNQSITLVVHRRLYSKDSSQTNLTHHRNAPGNYYLSFHFRKCLFGFMFLFYIKSIDLSADTSIFIMAEHINNNSL